MDLEMTNKPCPFCRKQPTIVPYFIKGIANHLNYFASCSCGIKTRSRKDYIGAVKDWNTRPLEDALQKRIEELEYEGFMPFLYAHGMLKGNEVQKRIQELLKEPHLEGSIGFYVDTDFKDFNRINVREYLALCANLMPALIQENKKLQSENLTMKELLRRVHEKLNGSVYMILANDIKQFLKEKMSV